jgi:hypothetical protein
MQQYCSHENLLPHQHLNFIIWRYYIIPYSSSVQWTNSQHTYSWPKFYGTAICPTRVVIKYSHQKICTSLTCIYLMIYFTYSNAFDIKTWEILFMQNIVLKFPVTATCFLSDGSQSSSYLTLTHNLSQKIPEQQLKISKKQCPLIFPTHH